MDIIYIFKYMHNSILNPNRFRFNRRLCVKFEEEVNIYATSNVGLAELKKVENLYLSHLTNYVDSLEEKVNLLNKYIKSITHENLKDEKQRFKYVTNSLNSFRLVRRVHEDWSKWLAYIKDHEIPIEEMDKLVAQVPIEVDMKEALMGMERIERFYDLKAADIAKGLIGSKQLRNEMSAPECLILAEYLYNNTEYHRAAEWYRLALHYEKQPENSVHREIYNINRNEIRKMFLQSRIKEAKN